ncbi:MAG: NAD(+)/NADH kinase [Nitrososphaerota archaeon]
MEKITVVYASTRAEAVETAKRLESYLENHKIQHAVMPLSDFDRLQSPPTDGVLMVLGGDGTMLRATRRVTSPEIAVVGVNYGRAGYLCQIQPSELNDAIEKIITGDFQVDKVLRLTIYLGERSVGDILNEVYLSSKRPGRIIEYNVSQDDLSLVDVADGLIVATPIGSTAYALSAGGPAVHEGVDAMVVVPLASMTNLRPMVVPSTIPLKVVVSKGEPQILVDGHTAYDVGSSVISVVKSNNSLNFLRLKGQVMFSRRLRKRLYGRA